jgi:type III pantothenate kinase
MFLACDIGNSQIKTGLFSDDKLLESEVFKSIDEVVLIYSRNNISNTGISSVVPKTSAGFIEFLEQKSLPYHLITVNSNLNLTINYKTPDTLGVDRICSAEGAFSLNGKMGKDEIILSVDFGTATTINVILYPGEFAGGVIAPGVKMMGNALHSYTAQLPQFSFADFEDNIGKSTRSSIASGLINATLGMIERVFNIIAKTYDTNNIKMFITGGNAGSIIPYIDFDFIFDKNLVLYGIKAVSDLNMKA